MLITFKAIPSRPEACYRQSITTFWSLTSAVFSSSLLREVLKLFSSVQRVWFINSIQVRIIFNRECAHSRWRWQCLHYSSAQHLLLLTSLAFQIKEKCCWPINVSNVGEACPNYDPHHYIFQYKLSWCLRSTRAVWKTSLLHNSFLPLTRKT